jgi:hypothetical protein
MKWLLKFAKSAYNSTMKPGSFAMVGIFFVALGVARAEMVAMTFSGYVTNTSGNAIPGLATNDLLYGTVIYDSTARGSGGYSDLVTSFSARVGTNFFSLTRRPPPESSSQLLLVDNMQVFTTISDELELRIAASSLLDTNAAFFFRINLREAGSSAPSALQNTFLPPLGTFQFSERLGYVTRQPSFEPRECRFRIVYFRHSPIPPLGVALSGTNVVLTWPARSPSFFPEISAPPDRNWAWVTNQRVLDGATYRVVQPATENLQFFRLKMD